MSIDHEEERRIRATIDRLTAIDELAAYRSHLREQHAGDPRLTRIEQVIELRMHDLLSSP